MECKHRFPWPHWVAQMQMLFLCIIIFSKHTWVVILGLVNMHKCCFWCCNELFLDFGNCCLSIYWIGLRFAYGVVDWNLRAFQLHNRVWTAGPDVLRVWGCDGPSVVLKITELDGTERSESKGLQGLEGRVMENIWDLGYFVPTEIWYLERHGTSLGFWLSCPSQFGHVVQFCFQLASFGVRFRFTRGTSLSCDPTNIPKVKTWPP